MSRALGRYELLRPLARGGMADVYLARRRAAGIEKWLVVKRMRPETSGDPRFLDLFVREARLSMSLVHQNIVPVFDFGRIDDQVFLAMERVEGKDLGSSLARAPTHRMPPLLVAFVAAECCQALDYAHQRKSPDGVALGIVHRDVTPRNVLLSWAGEVKLTDFGIAALAGDASRSVLGTPLYMAPEQARSEPIDPRADIYAVGLVMREAISGQRSRPGGDREAILDAARRGELAPWPHAPPPPAAQRAPADAGDLGFATGSGDHTAAADDSPGEPPPAALIAIIDRATAARPGDRYPDVRSMLEELDSFMVAQRAAHKGDSPPRQLAAWLAAIWEGERDDATADATRQAEHLVSFLDDGGLDLLGTGTVRSLAGTEADDVDADAPGDGSPPATEPAPAAGAAHVANPGSPARSPQPPSAQPPEASPSRTTASGVIRVGPSPRAARPARRVLAGLLATGAVAAAVAVVYVRRSPEPPRAGQLGAGDPRLGQPSPEHPGSNRERNNAGDPDPGQPGLGPPKPGQPDPGHSNPGQPNPGHSNPGQPNPGHSNPGQPSPGYSAIGQPNPRQPNPGHSNPGQPNPGQPTPGHSNPGQPTTGQTSPGQPATGQPATGQPNPGHAAGRPGTGQPRSGQDTTERPSGSAPQDPPNPGQTSRSDGTTNRAAAPRGCRVRINFTPWAYYTVGDDPTRHETPSTIVLPPGPHRLRVWNPELHIERDITINVPADRETMNYSEPLQRPTLPAGAGSLP